MSTVILTGASRGIGRALALGLAREGRHLVLLARDAAALRALADELRARGATAEVEPRDLSSLDEARAAGEALAARLSPGAVLVHNAGIWPAKRERVEGGLERAFVVNHLAPLVLQRPLLDADRLARVHVVSAGLLIKGRFDPERTPTGDDFSAFRTYASTKLCFALACRDLAEARPALEVVVQHPGVARTALGDRAGPLGALLRLVKRGWEAPEDCAARVVRALEAPASPGEAAWLVEDERQPWPPNTEDARQRAAVREVSDALLRARGYQGAGA